jgi:hypothetical protein
MPVSLLSSKDASCTRTLKRLSWRSRRLLMKLLQMPKQSEDSGQSSLGQRPPQAPSLWRKRRKPTLPLTKPKSWQTSLLSFPSFFKLQEQLAEHIREEEEKSKTVYDPDANLMEAALKRVMAQDQMALLETEIREAMVYGAPKEMGALYSKCLICGMSSR